MRTVLRIARAYSAIVPLQSWLTLLGGLLLFIALLLVLIAGTPGGIGAVVGVGMTGAVLIALVPTLTGGVAMRFGSSRSMLYLRPWGRMRMLAAATLVITLLAALLALPALLSQVASDFHGINANSGRFQPGVAFAVGWSLIAAIWIVVFITSSSRVFSFLLVFPMFLMPRLLFGSKTGILPSLPGPYAWFAAALATWVLFAIWYVQARSFRAPRWAGDSSSQSFENTPPGLIASLFDFSKGVMTASRASSQLMLGTVSPLRFAVVTTAWCAAFVVFFSVVTPASRGGGGPAIDMMLALGAMFAGQVGYVVTRRARLLWLRTGSDRASFFVMAESHGLRASLWFLVLFAGLLSVHLLVRRSEAMAVTLRFAAMQTPAWLAAFYCGMSVTRNWDLDEIGVCLGVSVLLMTGSVMIRPDHDASPFVQVAFVALASVLAWLLRRYAKRRWIKLDWRIARLPVPGQRSN